MRLLFPSPVPNEQVTQPAPSGHGPRDRAQRRRPGDSPAHRRRHPGPRRIRRLVEYMEKQGVIVVRADFGGRRSIGIPELGLSTEAE